MIRPNIGVRLTAIAVGVVGTAGVAAAATLPQTPAAHVAVAPHVEANVGGTPAGLPNVTVPNLPDLTAPSLPDVSHVVSSLPTLPKLPSVPGVPTGSLPVDPSQLAGTATQTVAAVTDLLPTPAELQKVVMDCVSDFTALAPVPVPTPSSISNPMGMLNGLLGMLGHWGGGSVPTPPSPAAVQAAVTHCVQEVLALLPDPGALASAITTSFGSDMPAPVMNVVSVLLGEAGHAPDAQHLVDLIGALTGATGSPTSLVHQLTSTLEGILPPQVAGLVQLPLSIVDQVLAGLGLA